MAFSVPVRTFLVTRDRILNGVKSARAKKRKARESERKARDQFKAETPSESRGGVRGGG